MTFLSNYYRENLWTTFVTALMWLTMSGGEKAMSPCESNKQPLTVCHIKIVTKVVVLEKLLIDTDRKKKKKKRKRL